MEKASSLRQLKEQLDRGKVVLFVGDSLENGISPTARLTRTLVEKTGAYCSACGRTGRCQSPENCVIPLTTAAQIYESYFGHFALVEVTQELLADNLLPKEMHRAIAALPVNVIITTCYDQRLSVAIKEAGKKVSEVVHDADLPYDSYDRVQLVYLNGQINQPDSLVLTEDDAIDLFRRLPTVMTVLQGHFATKSLLFLGYRLNDPFFLMLYRQATEPISRHVPRDFAVMCPADEATAKRWHGRIEIIPVSTPEFVRQLISKLNPHPEKTDIVAFPNEPYKFLDYFTREDRAIFHGRKRDAEHVCSSILAHQILVLYGDSGTGKTSLIQAAVAPRLEAEGFEIAYFRAALNPAENLRQFSERGHSLHDKGLVVVLDQFEEMYIHHDTLARARVFQDLATLINTRSGNVRLFISLRSDYLDRLDELAPFLHADPLQYRIRLFNLGAAEARDAITKPASDYHMELDPALVEQLLVDLQQEGIAPSHLQIICFTLWREWQRQQCPPSGLTLELYRELGGTPRILADYLQNVVQGTQNASNYDNSTADSQGQKARAGAQAILKSLVSAEKTKLVARLEDIATSPYVSEVALDLHQTQTILKYLQDRRVVRLIPDLNRYELAHDVMVAKVWDWFSESERETIDLQDMLVRATRDYRKLRALLPLDRLVPLTEHAHSLSFSEDSLDLLLLSSIEQSLPTRVWIEKMDKEHSLELLTGLLETEKRRNWPEIALALGHTHSEGAIRHLQNLLHDGSDRLLSATVEALVELGSPKVIQSLYQAARRETRLPRIAKIIDGLEAIHDIDAISKLELLASEHSNLHARMRIQRALSRVDLHRAVILTARELRSEDAAVRSTAQVALQQMFRDHGTAVGTAIERLIATGNRDTFLSILQCLAISDSPLIETVLLCTRHRDAAVREASAHALGRLNDRRAREGLFSQLADEEPTVREAALIGLARLNDEKITDAIAAMLVNKDIVQRAVIVNPLFALTVEQATEALSTALKSDDPETRRLAIELMGSYLVERSEFAIEFLLKSLLDPNSDVRLAAIHTWGSVSDTQVLRALTKALDDESPEVQYAALAALGRTEETVDTSQLPSPGKGEHTGVPHQRHSELLLVKKAQISNSKTIKGVGNRRSSPNYVGPRAPRLPSPDSDFREAIAKSIQAHISGLDLGQEAELNVLSGLYDANPSTRMLSVVALAEIWNLPDLAPLGNGQALVRRAAVQSLGDNGTVKAVVPLIATLLDENQRVVRMAARSLAKIGDIRATIPLVAAMESTELEARTREVAAMALKSLEDRRATAAMLRVLQSRDQPPGIRQASARALGAWHVGEASSVLLRILSDPEEHPQVRASTALALAEVCESRAISILIAIIKSTSENIDLRRQAVRALSIVDNSDISAELQAASKSHNWGARDSAIIALNQVADRLSLPS